ncbi:transcriptional regulator LeuO [Mangrovibacter plantisponsor]|uniref:LysR family transcriptional activator for leuABCD operon n=1 Tax=Mangrovibacter plantisponsor TaxID=451513 RepID=A0A317PZA7_9ENTR|nr:transcriptional regulator LeuO [Mangrovibacter plantisponsor]PWW09000.1 LysR family transcriptional activator for leuABCD operon [Mangrovibacter plantisponsor]
MSEKIIAKRRPEEDINLRLKDKLDLNLIPVFSTVMQRRNITKAAQVLGMSQPAVSNAISRLKKTFGDPLFVRQGRGIEPTPRAFQLEAEFQQALFLIHNVFPPAHFEPHKSSRVFTLAVLNPLDTLFLPRIYQYIHHHAPGIRLNVCSGQSRYTLDGEHVDFMLGYESTMGENIVNRLLFEDEMVGVAKKTWGQNVSLMTESAFYRARHAVVSLKNSDSFSAIWYDTPLKRSAIAYQGQCLFSLLEVVSRTNLIAIMPTWVTRRWHNGPEIIQFTLPLAVKKRACYLTGYTTNPDDPGFRWMLDTLTRICQKP